MLVSRLTVRGMNPSVTGDPGRRTLGLLGELAASLYLFHSDVPWLEARERQAMNTPTPDLYPYDGLEIKTLTKPSHALAPVNHAFDVEVDTLWVQFTGTDEPDAPSFDIVGWLTASQARAIWNESQRTFTDGWRCIPVECLSPAHTCPWRLEA
jgi:hypothetical protein